MSNLYIDTDRQKGIYAHIHDTHANIHTCIHTYRHTYMHTYRHAYIRTCRQTYIHTDRYTYIQTDMCIYVRTYIHTYILTYICACMYDEWVDGVNTLTSLTLNLSKRLTQQTIHPLKQQKEQNMQQIVRSKTLQIKTLPPPTPPPPPPPPPHTHTHL